jgi:hypothetical protein
MDTVQLVTEEFSDVLFNSLLLSSQQSIRFLQITTLTENLWTIEHIDEEVPHEDKGEAFP